MNQAHHRRRDPKNAAIDGALVAIHWIDRDRPVDKAAWRDNRVVVGGRNRYPPLDGEQ